MVHPAKTTPTVAELIALSRATLANIWQNVTLALALKGVFLATTLFRATPLWIAILADTGATVLVTANALRLLRFRSLRWGAPRNRPAGGYGFCWHC
jgi:cation transport ATPase